MAKAKAASQVKARILVANIIFGEEVKADDVVSGTAEQIDYLVESGVADKHASAVKYALGLDGNRLIELVNPDIGVQGEATAADIEALTEEIAGLEQKLGEAAEEEKAAIEIQIAAKREELKELQG